MRRMYSKPQLLEAVESEAKVNGIKVFEDIKDKDGNPRFIEGNITLETIAGVSISYAKWSLSGTHLIIVLAGEFTDDVILGPNDVFGNMTIPSYIGQKIFPQTSNDVLEVKSVATFNEYGSLVDTFNAFIQKISNTQLMVGNFGTSSTMANGSAFRIAFDLLIDNE